MHCTGVDIPRQCCACWGWPLRPPRWQDALHAGGQTTEAVWCTGVDVQRQSGEEPPQRSRSCSPQRPPASEASSASLSTAPSRHALINPKGWGPAACLLPDTMSLAQAHRPVLLGGQQGPVKGAWAARQVCGSQRCEV